ncbi:MAG: PIN domain-containing protein [Planctomycetota bacterium]|jgi:hypothetical protein|nr:PIN domain-containing protein [Planctomycetota bacterium]
MTLIDTSAWIEFFRKQGNRDIKLRVAEFIDIEDAAYCGPVSFEVMTGARKSEMPIINQAFEFSTLLEFPHECWLASAEIEKELRKQGITVPRDDIFVAAAALHHNVPLYADDRHFEMNRDTATNALMLV